MLDQEIKKISFQGEVGAYSHLALKSVFKNAEAVPCISFKYAMDKVSDFEVDAAIIPVENSQWGRVADVHFLLPETNLKITGEFFHRVKHQLLVLPDAELSDITHVHSHPQALGQCLEKISKIGITPVAAYDTAGAAKNIRQWGDKTQAAIASELAAELYDLKIIQSDFEDVGNNTTRFLIMERDPHTRPTTNDNMITAFLVWTKHIPAALYKILGGFATNGVNMLRLESYVDPSHFKSLHFYIEIAGHPNDLAVERAFEELSFFSRDFKILGVFEADNFRNQNKDIV